MRIISQDGTIDIPYENSMVFRDDENILYLICGSDAGKVVGRLLARYITPEKAQKAIEMLRTAYTGRFVTSEDVPDDFNERLQELMKGGFGTVIVKDRYDSRVEFNNLNGYFQFPQDEDVEV